MMGPADPAAALVAAAGAPNKRAAFLAVALQYLGMHETSPTIAAVIAEYQRALQWPAADRKPVIPWCALWVTYLLRNNPGLAPRMKWIGSTRTLSEAAVLRPAKAGDRFGALCTYPGHTGAVVAEYSDGRGPRVLTIEGNLSNKVSLRDAPASTWARYYAWWEDYP
jgi:hypothetical protein